MYKFLTIMCIVAKAACAESGWIASAGSFGGLGGLAPERDECVRVIVTPAESELGFGPLLFWRANKQGELIQITGSLSALSHALGQITHRKRGDELRYIVKNALVSYCRPLRAKLLSDEERVQTLAELAERDPLKATALASLAGDMTETWNEKDWTLTFSVLLESGAVEKHSFRGEVLPFSISGHQLEITAHPGAFPLWP